MQEAWDGRAMTPQPHTSLARYAAIRYKYGDGPRGREWFRTVAERSRERSPFTDVSGFHHARDREEAEHQNQNGRVSPRVDQTKAAREAPRGSCEIRHSGGLGSGVIACTLADVSVAEYVSRSRFPIRK